MTSNAYNQAFHNVHQLFGQNDDYRTRAILWEAFLPIHADIAPRLVREFAQWLVAFDAIPEGERLVTMNDIITNAQAALLLPANYVVEGGDSGIDGQIDDKCGPNVRAAYERTGTEPLAVFARKVVGLDDPALSTIGAQARRVTALRDLIAQARQALADAGIRES